MWLLFLLVCSCSARLHHTPFGKREELLVNLGGPFVTEYKKKPQNRQTKQKVGPDLPLKCAELEDCHHSACTEKIKECIWALCQDLPIWLSLIKLQDATKQKKIRRLVELPCEESSKGLPCGSHQQCSDRVWTLWHKNFKKISIKTMYI